MSPLNLNMIKAGYRFYGPLNEFLSPEKRKTHFFHSVKGNPSVKDTVEALGVPHPEIDCLFINGKAVNFFARLADGDEVRVYPVGYQPKGALHLAAAPKRVKFVVDSHLGKLARHLRLLGFDCLYKTIFPDKEIAALAASQKRIVLTRDLGLLKNKIIEHGYFVRSFEPLKQLREVLKRFRLGRKCRPFRRCLECNGLIKKVRKSRVLAELPQQTKLSYQRFYKCVDCQKVYWRGAHYARLVKIVAMTKNKS